MSGKLAQFGGSDGLDHSREVQRLLAHLGQGPHADRRRAAFLRSLLPSGDPWCAHLPALVAPCDAVQAYFLLLQIIAVLGVPIKEAFDRLERFTKDVQRAPAGRVVG